MTPLKFVMTLYALLAAAVVSLSALVYFISSTVVPDAQERGMIAVAEASLTAWFTFPATGIVLPSLGIWFMIRYRDALIDN